MDGDAAARLVDRIVRQLEPDAPPLVFDPVTNGATTTIDHRGFAVEVGVGRCDQGSLDLIVGVALGAVPPHDTASFLEQLLEWNHCTSGIGHFSLDDHHTVYLVSRHGLEGLDAAGLTAIIGAMVSAAAGAVGSMALAELSAGVIVE